MDLDEFIKEIDHPDADWRVSPLGYIRDKDGLCPVCHLAVRKGHSFKNIDYFKAGEALGLVSKQTRDIAYASDSRMVRPLMRIRLLDATGLKETV